MGRLVSETADTFSANYTYDTFGNRATKQQIKDGVTSNTAYTYDLADRLTYLYEASGENASEITYTYDNAGNLINRLKGFYEPLSNNEYESISVTTGTSPYVDMFAYNALGQLTSADIGGNVSSYTYDADGLRNSITSIGATTNLVNISGNVVSEITPNGTASYYRAGNQIMYSNNGTANNVYTYNGHGDVIKVGTDVYTYDAFGNTLAESTNGQPFRYCGEYQDLCSGLIYLRNRYYDPSIGRFITEDPARDGLNWYVYCDNNPVMFVDRNGLSITISGIKTKDDERFIALQNLTDDTLEVDFKTGNVSYSASDSIEREVATNLVRDVIDNSINCEISFYEEQNGTTTWWYDKNGTTTKVEISYNPGYSPSQWSYVEGEGYGKREKPNFIVLGHELIHAHRKMNGVVADNDATNGYYLSGPQPGKTLLRVAKPEELETTGIDYVKVINKNWSNAIRVNASNNYYSENALRLEYDYAHQKDKGYAKMGRRAGY